MVVGTILNSTSDVRQHRGTYFLPLILIALLRPHSLDSVHEPFSVLGIVSHLSYNELLHRSHSDPGDSRERSWCVVFNDG
jgi:hypothetical protein